MQNYNPYYDALNMFGMNGQGANVEMVMNFFSHLGIPSNNVEETLYKLCQMGVVSYDEGLYYLTTNNLESFVLRTSVMDMQEKLNELMVVQNRILKLLESCESINSNPTHQQQVSSNSNDNVEEKKTPIFVKPVQPTEFPPPPPPLPNFLNLQTVKTVSEPEPKKVMVIGATGAAQVPVGGTNVQNPVPQPVLVPKPDHVVKVSSFTDNLLHYDVDVINGACSCPHFKWHQPIKCKHIKTVMDNPGGYAISSEELQNLNNKYPGVSTNNVTKVNMFAPVANH